MKSLLSQISRIKRQDLPLVILKKTIIFPSLSTNVVVEEEIGLKAIEASLYEGRLFLVAFPKDEDFEGDFSTLTLDQLYEVGVVAHSLQILKMPDKKIHLFLEGKERVRLVSLTPKLGYFQAHIDALTISNDVSAHVVALMRNVEVLFEQFARAKKLKTESVRYINKIESPHKMVDVIAPHLETKYTNKIQKFLLNRDPVDRLQDLAEELRLEIDFFEIKEDIEKKVSVTLARNQKEYFLNEQMREIQKRLNREDEGGGLLARIKGKSLPKEIQEKLLKEYRKLELLAHSSPESGILRGYIDWMLDLPWGQYSLDHFDWKEAKEVLSKGHYGMKEAKEHILEFLVVRSLAPNSRQPIICLVGPPGTGKTSIAQSIARSLNRKFVQMSLGGVRDEAEIRGHRRTYVGALPGKIIQSMKRAEVMNPVFLLDEIEKMSSDYRGDPASAMLEVLDPEQNKNFVDHYIEVPFDLSQVLFIATANSLDTVPAALLDRMEVIQVKGYTYYEKCLIARDFFLPRLLKENGLHGLTVEFSSQALLKIIHDYTAESGVRSLYRAMTKLLRKLVKEMVVQTPCILEKQRYSYPASYLHNSVTGVFPRKDNSFFYRSIEVEDVLKYLGERVPPALIHSKQAGLVYGLAWTAVGGKVLAVEALTFPGEGKLILTGSLGKVMKESAHIAYSLARKLASQKLAGSLDSSLDLHLHCPEGATPKDGPSAGVTMTMAMMSAFLNRPLRLDTAMTGELSLTGNLLAVGGVHEKILAAYRFNLKRVILPVANRTDTHKLPEEVKKLVKFYYVSHISEVWDLLDKG